MAGEGARDQSRVRFPLLGASFDVAEEERPVDAPIASSLASRAPSYRAAPGDSAVLSQP